MGKSGAFFAGALCGLVAGIFMAPKAGSESRADAADQLRNIWGQGQDYYQKGVQRFQSSVSSMRPGIDQKNDQLQAKIDAARKIISEQVAKNAAEAAAAAAEAEEAGVEVAAEVADGVSDSVAEVAEAAEGAVAEATAPAESEQF